MSDESKITKEDILEQMQATPCSLRWQYPAKFKQ